MANDTEFTIHDITGITTDDVNEVLGANHDPLEANPFNAAWYKKERLPKIEQYLKSFAIELYNAWHELQNREKQFNGVEVLRRFDAHQRRSGLSLTEYNLYDIWYFITDLLDRRRTSIDTRKLFRTDPNGDLRLALAETVLDHIEVAVREAIKFSKHKPPEMTE